jgi:hypothetical protein
MDKEMPMSESMTSLKVPEIIADDDESLGRLGFLAVFETPDRKPFLRVYGASVTESGHTFDRGKLRITLRSKYRDDEGDYLFLLNAGFVGVTEWIGYPVLEGMLTQFLYRTEKQAQADKRGYRRGNGSDGYYWPKGPFREDEGYFHGKPVKAIRCRISLLPRGREETKIGG